MFGMETMSGAVEPLAQMEGFTRIFTMFSNPILGMLAGTVLTAVIQSSSASVGILQALCTTGAVTFGTAIPIIMGTEYRYLHYGYSFQYRSQQERQAGGGCAPVF